MYQILNPEQKSRLIDLMYTAYSKSTDVNLPRFTRLFFIDIMEDFHNEEKTFLFLESNSVSDFVETYLRRPLPFTQGQWKAVYRNLKVPILYWYTTEFFCHRTSIGRKTNPTLYSMCIPPS